MGSSHNHITENIPFIHRLAVREVLSLRSSGCFVPAKQCKPCHTACSHSEAEEFVGPSLQSFWLC